LKNDLQPPHFAPRPPLWPVFAAFVAAVVLLYAATAALVFGIAISRAGPHPAELAEEAMRFALSATGVMLCAFLSATVLATVAISCARLETALVCMRLRIYPSRASRAGVVFAVFGMIGVSLASAAICDLAGVHGHGPVAAIAHALRGPTPIRLALGLLTIAIAPGMAEELFFRGLVQTRLVSRWGRWPSIFATAFGFGLVHLDLLQGAVALVAGLFLGWVVEVFKGIRPAVAAHAVNNAAFVAVASFGSTKDQTRLEIVLIALVGLAVAGGSIAALRSPLAIRRDALSPPRR
jgi:membrane protease YdiL (CAAX protease family)